MIALLNSVALPDLVTFLAASLAALIGAVGVVVAKNAIHSALLLVMTLFSIAVLFIEQQADFLAAVQIVVYAGAIIVLFLFVIMLLGVDRRERIEVERLKRQRPLAMVGAILILVEVSLLARGTWATGAHSVVGSTSGSGSTNIELLARAIFTTYLLPFEATSVLLIIAVIGAVVLARRSPISGQDSSKRDTGTQ